MSGIKEKWDAFDVKNITESRTRDLLRLCGFAPRETRVAIPKSFEEFQALCESMPSPPPKEQMERMIEIFNIGKYISRDSLRKYLFSGDKLGDTEMEDFLKLCLFDDNLEISVKEFVDILYSE